MILKLDNWSVKCTPFKCEMRSVKSEKCALYISHFAFCIFDITLLISTIKQEIPNRIDKALIEKIQYPIFVK